MPDCQAVPAAGTGQGRQPGGAPGRASKRRPVRETDKVRLEGQLQNFFGAFGALFSTGIVGRRNQFSQGQVPGLSATGRVLCFVVGFHDGDEALRQAGAPFPRGALSRAL